MTDASIAWGVAAALGAAALGLLVRVATEGSRARETRDELDALHKEARALRKQLEQRTKAVRRGEAELERLTRRAGRAQKTAASAKGDARDERARLLERTRVLEEGVERAEHELDVARRALEEKGGALDAATRDLGDERAALGRALERAAAAEAAAEAAGAGRAADAAARRRAEDAEAALRERDDALAAARADVARLETKVATQDKLYVSIRSELAIKRERIRQQREEIERLRALEVVIADPPPADAESARRDAPAAPPPSGR